MFTAALFTVAKVWKQPTCPSVDEWVKKHNGILYSSKKEILTFCDSMDGPGDCYAKQNKPVGESKIPYESQIPYHLTYMWNLMNKVN